MRHLALHWPILAVTLLSVALAGCEDKKAKKELTDQVTALKADRDALAGELEQSRKALVQKKGEYDELLDKLRRSAASAELGLSEKARLANEKAEVQAELRMVRAQYDSLLTKNQVLEARAEELQKFAATLRQQLTSVGSGRSPQSQPDALVPAERP